MIKKKNLLTLDILEAAQRKKIKAEIMGEVIGKPLLKLTKNKKTALVRQVTTSQTRFIPVKIAQDKYFTIQLLAKHDLPIPLSLKINSVKGLSKALKQIKPPFVLKPNEGRQGKLVFCNLYNKKEGILALKKILKFYPAALIQEQLKGRDFRILVIDNKPVAILERIPPFIIGDGKSSIKDLIRKENEKPTRQEGKLKKIIVDQEVKRVLRIQKMRINSVPKERQKVFLRYNANISTGGMGIDFTEKIHPEQLNLALRAAEIIGLDIAGIDLITADITKPVKETGTKIIEVNAGPDIAIHYFPIKGKIRKAGKAIVEMLFPS